MTALEPVQIHADHDTVKRRGHWTTTRKFEQRARRSGAVILATMFSREYAEDVRRAHRAGTGPAVDDSARAGGTDR